MKPVNWIVGASRVDMLLLFLSLTWHLGCTDLFPIETIKLGPIYIQWEKQEPLRTCLYKLCNDVAHTKQEYTYNMYLICAYIYIHTQCIYIYIYSIYINTLYMQKTSTIVCMYRWWTDGRIDGWTDGLMNRWTDGWMYGCMDGWMYGCMHLRVRRNYMYICKKNYIHTYIYIICIYIYIQYLPIYRIP